MGEVTQMRIDEINKQYGKGAIMRLGEDARVDVDVLSTGIEPLDGILGIGGLPRGRVIEVFGKEGSGKTTMALHLIAECQKEGGKVAYVDAEHALDVAYAQTLGVVTDALFVSQPDSGEQALEITESLVRSGAIDLVVVDSVAALVPRIEIEGQMGDRHVGLQSRLMSQALRKLTAIAVRTRCMVVFINQIQQKIGVTFGNGEVTPGGNALKFYSSVRLEIRRIGSLQDGQDIVGNKTRIKVVKNKLAPPFRVCEVYLRYGQGFEKAVQKWTFEIEVTFDPNLADEDGLARAMDTLLETSLTPGILDEYGNPTFGEFIPLREQD